MSNIHCCINYENNNISSLQMEELEEKSLMITKNFVNYMDNPQSWASHILSDNAILDWFGRSVYGRDSIHHFIRTHILKMCHKVENISIIPPINHRSLKIVDVEPPSHDSDKSFMEEFGQGDCKGKATPENGYHTNVDELLKAPYKKRCQRSHSDVRNWQFLEVKGTLELGSEDRNDLIERKLQRIVLGCTDQIHLIVYEGRSNCRKKLASLFSIPDE